MLKPNLIQLKQDIFTKATTNSYFYISAAVQHFRAIGCAISEFSCRSDSSLYANQGRLG